MQVRFQNLILVYLRSVISYGHDRDAEIFFYLLVNCFTDQPGSAEERIHMDDEFQIRVIFMQVIDFKKVF
jgi:hypothetical protein